MTSKLYLYKATIKLLYLIERLGSFPNRLVYSSVRLSFYVVILITFFIGLNSNFLQTTSDNSQNLTVTVPEQIENTVQEVEEVLGVQDIPGPVIVNALSFPSVTAKSIIAVDIKNEKILYEKDMHVKYPPASTTKLMTALVSLDIYELEEVLTVPENCTLVASTRIGLTPNEKVKVSDLINSMLVSSAGDSACTLASVKLTPSEFIDKMNEKALSLELTNTSFTNAIGLDSIDSSHVSTAYDLYLLAAFAAKNPVISQIVKEQTYEFTSGAYPRTAYNTNELLWTLPGTIGIKTGKTEGAGEVLIYENKQEQDIIIVVMNSLSRFQDTTSILDWIFKSYSWTG